MVQAKKARAPRKGSKADVAAAGTSGAQDGTEPVQAAAPKARRAKAPKPEPAPVYSEAMRPAAPSGPTFKMITWNVAGLRALMKKSPGVFPELVAREAADVLCLQETKLQEGHAHTGLAEQMGLPGWHAHWNCSTARLGYSGVAVLSRVPPLSVRLGLGQEEHDGEGRLITAEFPDFFLVNVYVPNSGEGLRRLEYRVGPGGWDAALVAHLADLRARKPVVVTGDLNCAHQEIDIHSPKTNLRSAGFTQEERDSFASRLLCEACLADTFRRQHPGVAAYTYFTYKFNCRAKGKGWRLDYFLVSESLMERVHDSFLLPDVLGSDHVPIGLTLKA